MNSVICHKYYIYSILYGSLKSKEEEDPSLETLSVFGECRCPMPPMSRTSPDLSPQQRWLTLLSTSLTGSKMKLEIPSNLSQLLYASGLKKVPPHTILLQKVCPPLGWTRWSTEQVPVVIGLNASAKFLYFLLMKPPVMIIPGKRTVFKISISISVSKLDLNYYFFSIVFSYVYFEQKLHWYI